MWHCISILKHVKFSHGRSELSKDSISIYFLITAKSEEVAHASQNVMNLLPRKDVGAALLSGLQECNYMTLQYK